MSTVTQFKPLSKAIRREVLLRNPGLLQRVAEKTGKTASNVSRVYHGYVKHSPEIQAALQEELAKINLPE